MLGRRRRPAGTGTTTVSAAAAHRAVRVVRVEGGVRVVRRLAALGIVPGARITVDRPSGPALVSIGHTRVAIGREAARAILVEDDCG